LPLIFDAAASSIAFACFDVAAVAGHAVFLSAPAFCRLITLIVAAMLPRLLRL